MWGILKKNGMQRKPKNIDQLWEFSQEEQQKIPLEAFTKAFNSIPKRIRAGIKAKVSHTKY